MPFAVFLHEPRVDADDLVAVFAAAGFRTAVDARGAVARAAGGVVVDDADEVSAARLADALSHRGYAASVIDVARLALPPLQRTKEVIVKDDAFAVADSLGRLVPLPFADVRLVAAATTKTIATQAATRAQPSSPGSSQKVLGAAVSLVVPGAQTAAKMIKAFTGGGGAAPSTSMVEVDETWFEIVALQKRLRIDQSGAVFRVGGPRSLAELAAVMHAKLPATTTRQRGFVALANNEPAPRLRSPREFERELNWCLWRASQQFEER